MSVCGGLICFVLMEPSIGWICLSQSPGSVLPPGCCTVVDEARNGEKEAEFVKLQKEGGTTLGRAVKSEVSEIPLQDSVWEW